MNNKIDGNFIPRFLTDRRFSVYRHLLLQAFVLLMSLEIFFDAPDKVNFSTERVYGWLSYYLFMNVIIYVNMYILAPRFLIKNKFVTYLISVVILLVLSLLTVAILQQLFYDISVINEEEINPLVVMLNMSSTILSIGAFVIGISTILLFKHWIIYNERASKLESTTLESELKFLKSQINPHFLFNMLNNANIMVDEDPQVASRILVKLDDLLRYQLNDSTRDKVYLNADILFLTDFLDLEKTRRDDFDYTISKEGDVNNVEVPPLLFIPFVENAVKHNSDSENLSYVAISFRVQSDKLIFTCENSKPKKPSIKKDGGLGLTNIKRRLDLLYGDKYSLKLNETDTNYIVHLTLNI